MSTFNRYMRGMSGCGLATGEALTDDQLRQAVPSIFATEAHESRSDRFVPLPTIDVLNGLRTEGFDPFFAQQARTRIAGKAEFTKHMMRLRHRSITNAGGEAFEIILVNANDGTSSYQMIPGYFRFVCANGLMVGDTFNEVKVRHSGNATSEVIEGAFTVLEDAEEITEQVQRFKGITVTEGERNVLAEAAHQLRFPDAYKEDGRPAPVAADRLLHTRAVGGIDQNKALNRALWTLTERMAELKAA